MRRKGARSNIFPYLWHTKYKPKKNMKRYILIPAITCMMTCMLQAQHTQKVESVKVAGPYVSEGILMTTEKDANGTAYDTDEMQWNTPMDMTLWKKGTDSLTIAENDSAGFVLKGKGIWQLGFTIQNQRWQKVTFDMKAKGRCLMYVDGNEYKDNAKLVAGRHDVVVKLQEKTDEADTILISLSAPEDTLWTAHCSGMEINPSEKRYFTLQDQMTGWRLNQIAISATGRYVMQWRHLTRKDGSSEWKSEIIDTRNGTRYAAEGYVQWAAKGDEFIARRTNRTGKTEYYYQEVASGKQRPILTLNVEGDATFVAQDTKILLRQKVDGPKEKNSEVHQILTPDDRIAGWRDRNNYAIMDIATGRVSQLTGGFRNVDVVVSEDGKMAVITTRHDDETRRPFNFSDCFLMNLETHAVDTLYRDEGYVANIQFSPDGTKLLIQGSPEALGGIGNVCSKDLIPNTYDYQLYVMDLQTKEMKPLTRDFDPSIDSYLWSKADGNIYAMAEIKDQKGIFVMSGKALAEGKTEWKQLALNEPYTFHSWDMATDKPLLVYSGESGMTSDRSWMLDLKTGKHTLLNDLNEERIGDVKVGLCQDWNFRNARGEEISGCYYLPPYFDETKQYPMLVYYYGGVSPTGRLLDSPYCYQAWAAMGYVVYVLQPAGCTGFGQKFSALHSNAWGEYTANDIIEGTTKFCQEHPFVNSKKVGCLGASYGGFMTQYLQTQTDLFAAAVSHAGISNVTSYWGEGYWGYSYNACAAPNSFPWNNPQLYTEHSPLFRADKINTPILFLHGGSDTNVPVGESIQMFNALKILGKETAFVMVDGQDHYIGDHQKRIYWHNTLMAWFQKWLQDDPSWWNELYPEKHM